MRFLTAGVPARQFLTGEAGQPFFQAEDKEVKSWQRMISCPREKHPSSAMAPSMPSFGALVRSCRSFRSSSLYDLQPFWFSVSPAEEREKQASGFFFFSLGQVFVLALRPGVISEPFRVCWEIWERPTEHWLEDQAQETSHRLCWQLAGSFLL